MPDEYLEQLKQSADMAGTYLSGDGSESAGLRERLQKQFSDLLPELVTSADSTICVCPQECKADVVKELVDAALAALAPAISRPPANRSLKEKWEAQQGSALPPSRADLGGDRITQSEYMFSIDEIAEIVGPYVNLSQFRDCFELIRDRIEDALEIKRAVAEGQQSSELVEKTPSASPGPMNSKGHWGPCTNPNHNDSQEGPCERHWIVESEK